MKYKEMKKFLMDNGIKTMQPVIANEVDAQLEVDITDEEFEEICDKLFNIFLDCIEEPDVWYLVDEELTSRGYKER